MTLNELGAILLNSNGETLLYPEQAKVSAQTVLDRFDANGDGVLQYHEVVALDKTAHCCCSPRTSRLCP